MWETAVLLFKGKVFHASGAKILPSDFGWRAEDSFFRPGWWSSLELVDFVFVAMVLASKTTKRAAWNRHSNGCSSMYLARLVKKLDWSDMGLGLCLLGSVRYPESQGSTFY